MSALTQSDRAPATVDPTASESDRRYQDFAEVSSDWFWEMDADLRFSWFSERYGELPGIDTQASLGVTRQAFWRDDSPECESKSRHLADLAARRPFRDFRYKFTTLTGEELWVSTSGKPIFDENGTFVGYRGVGRDITAEVRAQREIARLGHRNAFILNAMREGIFGIDRDLRIVFANRAATALLSSCDQNLIGRRCYEAFGAKSSETGMCGTRCGNLMTAVMATGEESDLVEDRVVRQDGTSFPVEMNCVPVVDGSDENLAAVIVFRDITRPRTAEAEREQERRRQDAILNAIPDIAWLKDADGAFTEVNQAFIDMLGRPKDEIIGRQDTDFFPTKMAERFVAGDVEVINAKKSQCFEERIVWPSGCELWLETHKAPLLDTEGDAVGTIGIARNITKRRNSEESLRKLSIAVEQSPSVVVITGTDGTIEYVNHAFERVSGYAAVEVIGQTPGILGAGQTSRRVYQKLWNTILAGEEWSGEFLNKRKDGSLFWEKAHISPVKNPNGETTHFLAMKDDITHRKKIEDKIKQSLGFQRASNRLLRVSQGHGSLSEKLENMLDIVFTLDWMRVLPRAVLYLDAPDQERHQVFSEYNLHDESSAVVQSIDPKAPHYAGFLEAGIVRYFGATVTAIPPYWDASIPQATYEIPVIVGGAPIGLLVISAPSEHTTSTEHESLLKAMSDILAMTVERDRKSAELVRHRDHLQSLVDAATAEIREKADALEVALEKQTELNALQRQFVAMASHEFRTPLAIIDSTAQRIGRRYAKGMSPEDMAERLERIRNAVDRMIGLIESTLSAARLDEGKVQISPEECAIKALVAEVCERQQDISPQHRVVVDIERLPLSIVADPKAMDQVFTNLLSNAVKYSPEGGQVDVIGRVESGSIEVVVHDCGLGIPADELPQLFERFFRARTSTGIVGTGIGLHLVKQLVEMHSGAIRVNSIEGEGSTFIVTVPLGPAASSEDIADLENHDSVASTMEIVAPGRTV